MAGREGAAQDAAPDAGGSGRGDEPPRTRGRIAVHRAGAPAGAARLAAPAPAAATGGTPAEVARVEPTFGGVAPADTPADLQAEATGIDAPAESVEPVAAAAAPASAHDTHAEPAEPAEPVLPAATTISSAPPAIVDRRIDCIVPIRLRRVAAGRQDPAGRAVRRAGSKPVHIEGKPEGGQWELLQNGVRYEELRAAAQLANRSGALNGRVLRRDGRPAVRRRDRRRAGIPGHDGNGRDGARADAFAAQCDAQLSINVMSDGAPWSANYVQAVASQDGLLLSRDGTRFVKLDAKQNPVFMLQFGDTNFLRDDLTYKGGNMITLVLDVPVAEEDIPPFRLMCDYAKSLSERIGARVVDDSRRAARIDAGRDRSATDEAVREARGGRHPGRFAGYAPPLQPVTRPAGGGFRRRRPSLQCTVLVCTAARAARIACPRCGVKLR